MYALNKGWSNKGNNNNVSGNDCLVSLQIEANKNAFQKQFG